MNSTFSSDLFLDSDIIIGGLINSWGVERAILSLCAAKTCRLVLTEFVQREVERSLLKFVEKLGEKADQLLNDYQTLIKLARPKLIPLPLPKDLVKHRHLFKDSVDLPFIISAMNCQPNWIITNNREIFTDEIATKIGVKIASPPEFFHQLAQAFEI